MYLPDLSLHQVDAMCDELSENLFTKNTFFLIKALFLKDVCTPATVIKIIPPPRRNVFHRFPNQKPFLSGVSIYLYEVIARPNIRATWKGIDHQ